MTNIFFLGWTKNSSIIEQLYHQLGHQYRSHRVTEEDYEFE